MFDAQRVNAGLLIATAVASESVGVGASETEVVALDSFDIANNVSDIVDAV